MEKLADFLFVRHDAQQIKLILKPYEITIIIIAMLQMSKLMLREICPQICNQHLVV